MSQSLPLHPVVLDILGPGLTLHGDQDTVLLTEKQIRKMFNVDQIRQELTSSALVFELFLSSLMKILTLILQSSNIWYEPALS